LPWDNVIGCTNEMDSLMFSRLGPVGDGMLNLLDRRCVLSKRGMDKPRKRNKIAGSFPQLWMFQARAGLG
jgi:hypothetical protein